VLAFSLARGVVDYVAVCTALVLVCTASWAVLRVAGRLERLLGTTGIKVISRMMGLILASMAIQFVAEGLRDLFPILAHRPLF